MRMVVVIEHYKSPVVVNSDADDRGYVQWRLTGVATVQGYPGWGRD